jgi:multidrug efflux pump subunit AcrA (membrane-fusion protein)
MRNRLVIALIVGLIGLPSVPVNAATKPSVVTAAFKNLLNTTADSMDQLEQQYEADLDALDATLVAAAKSADDAYNQDLLAATNLYAPQIAAANKKAEDSKATYEANNKVRLTTGFFGGDADRLNWALDCLPAKAYFAGKMLKRYCGTVAGIPVFPESGYGYEDWQPGDITTIALRNADDKYVAIGIERAYIVPLNLLAFDTSRIGYKQALADSANLTALNGKARAAAQTKRDNAVFLATNTRESALADLDDAYETAKAELEAKETAAELALLAAKRASKDPSNFDSAFVVAYKFEYNRQMVNEIADAAWTGDWTYRTINSIIKVNRLAVTGDSIASRYSRSSATSFNSTVGKAFTNEPEFRAALKVLTSIYKKSTSTTLKFN